MYENDVNEDDSDYDKMIQNKVIDSLPSSHRKSPNNYTFEKLDNMGNEDNEEEIDSDIKMVKCTSVRSQAMIKV